MMEATGLCLVWLVCAVIDLRTSRVVFILSCAIIQLSTLAFATCIYRLSPWHPLSKFDGPVLYRVSSLSFAKVIMSGWRHRVVQRLHHQHGKFARIGGTLRMINFLCNMLTRYHQDQMLYPSTRIQQWDPSIPLHNAWIEVKHIICTSFQEMGFSSSLEETRTTPDEASGLPRSRPQSKPFMLPFQLGYISLHAYSLTEFEPILDRRTLQLIECIHARTDNLGAVDLARCLEDWSYDFMVRTVPSIFYISI